MALRADACCIGMKFATSRTIAVRLMMPIPKIFLSMTSSISFSLFKSSLAKGASPIVVRRGRGILQRLLEDAGDVDRIRHDRQPPVGIVIAHHTQAAGALVQ